MSKNRPVEEFRVRGGLQAAIWKDEYEKGGRTVDRYSIKFSKSYKDRESGDWKETSMILFPDELPKLRILLDQSYEFAMRHKQGSSEERQTCRE